MPEQTQSEIVAERVAAEMKLRVDSTVEAITASGGMGFPAHITPKQSLDYYKSLTILPDGTPNLAGIQQLIEGDGTSANPGIGAEGWAEVVDAMRVDWQRQLRGG